MKDVAVLDQFSFTGVADPNFWRDFAFGPIWTETAESDPQSWLGAKF